MLVTSDEQIDIIMTEDELAAGEEIEKKIVEQIVARHDKFSS